MSSVGVCIIQKFNASVFNFTANEYLLQISVTFWEKVVAFWAQRVLHYQPIITFWVSLHFILIHFRSLLPINLNHISNVSVPFSSNSSSVLEHFFRVLLKRQNSLSKRNLQFYSTPYGNI